MKSPARFVFVLSLTAVAFTCAMDASAQCSSGFTTQMIPQYGTTYPSTFVYTYPAATNVLTDTTPSYPIEYPGQQGLSIQTIQPVESVVYSAPVQQTSWSVPAATQPLPVMNSYFPTTSSCANGNCPLR